MNSLIYEVFEEDKSSLKIDKNKIKLEKARYERLSSSFDLSASDFDQKACDVISNLDRPFKHLKKLHASADVMISQIFQNEIIVSFKNLGCYSFYIDSRC